MAPRETTRVIQLKVIDPETSKQETLRRWDWIMLPLLSLTTIGVITVSTEVFARRLLSDTVGSRPACVVRNDNPLGARMSPMSVCWEKSAEGDLSEYRFNSCGDRADIECGIKAPDAYRIVMTGTSMAVGRYVSREKSFAALLPVSLSLKTGRKIELYNEGMMQGYLDSVGLRFDKVLAARPDMVLWILTPTDFKIPSFVPGDYEQPVLPESAGKALSLRRAWYLLKNAYATNGIVDELRHQLDRTRSALLLRHFLYQSQNLYVRCYLIGADDEAGFLRANLSAEWRKRLEKFKEDAAENQQQAKSAGVQMTAVLVPNRAQVAMISMGEWPEGFDPYRLDNELRAVVTGDGGTYISILPEFRDIPNPERGYFPVDGHPDAAGSAVISAALAKELTSGAVPAIGVTHPSQTALVQKR